MIIEDKSANPEFEPVVLTITIETIEELGSLWHRMNLNSQKVGEQLIDHERDLIVFDAGVDDCITTELYNFLEKYRVREKGVE